MSITYESITLRNIVQDAILVTTGNYILKNGLAKFDLSHLDKALANVGAVGGPADNATALTEYIMPNGSTALAYYDNFIVDLSAANASFKPSLDAFIDQTNASIADLDARVTTLEP